MIDILIMDDSGTKVEALRHVITNLLPHGEVKIDTARKRPKTDLVI